MRQRVFQFCVVFLTALLLVSCSGVPKSTPPPGGNSTLSLTMIDTPPANTSILSFKVVITGITLNPASGSPFSLPLPTNPSPVVELTRLQSDSAFLGTFTTVPAGTYSSMTIALGTVQITFANQTGGTISVGTSTCTNNTVCTASATPVQPSAVSFGSSGLNLSSNSPQGLSLDFNLNNAITFTGGTLGVDFSQAMAVSVATLPRTGSNLSTGQLELIEDFTGVVTNVNTTTKLVTVQSATRGTIAASANQATIFDDPRSLCTTADFTCVQANQTASVDVTLNSDGTFTLSEFEPLVSASTGAEDLIEGVVSTVSSSTTTQFQLVMSEKVQAATNTQLTGLNVGDRVQITIGAGAAFAAFFVDTKHLKGGANFPLALANSFANSTDNTVLAAGQAVIVHVPAGSFTPASGSTIAAATVDTVGLRWSRVTGTVATPASPNFNISGLPAFMPQGVPPNASIAAFGAPPLVATFQNITNFDGVTGVNSLSAGDTVSIRALFFSIPSSPPQFSAAKVRKH